jgi:hypothetical protein
MILLKQAHSEYLIPEHIFNKIKELDILYQTLLKNISQLDNTDVAEEDTNINILAKKFTLNDILNNNETQDDSFLDQSTKDLINNIIIQKELLEMVEKQNTIIALENAIKQDIPGLNTNLIENQYKDE